MVRRATEQHDQAVPVNLNQGPKMGSFGRCCGRLAERKHARSLQLGHDGRSAVVARCCGEPGSAECCVSDDPSWRRASSDIRAAGENSTCCQAGSATPPEYSASAIVTYAWSPRLSKTNAGWPCSPSSNTYRPASDEVNASRTPAKTVDPERHDDGPWHGASLAPPEARSSGTVGIRVSCSPARRRTALHDFRSARSTVGPRDRCASSEARALGSGVPHQGHRPAPDALDCSVARVRVA